MLKKGFYLLLTLILLGFTSAFAQKYELKTVVLDPGHGGKDPGTVVGNLREKDIVLDVCIKAGKLIKERYPDINVIYTRKTDVFIPLDTRAEIANKNKADLFISVHANHCGTPSVSGTETFILGLHRSQENLEVAKMENSVILLEEDYTTRYEGFDPNESESYIMFELIQDQFLEQSTLFANRMQNEFIQVGKRNSRGVKQAGFLVLRRTTMPSALIELGFLSNPTESQFLNSDKGKTDMAKSISNAFFTYKNKVETRSNASLVATNKSQNQPKPTTQVTNSNTDSITSENQDKTNNNEPTILEINSLQGKWYAIQIMSLGKEEKANSPLFKQQVLIYHLLEGGMHKYFLAPTATYKEMLKNLSSLKDEFKGAFPVGILDGQKLNVNSLKKEKASN